MDASLTWRSLPLAQKVFQFYSGRQFRRPIYDVARFFLNREPRKLCRRYRALMNPNLSEQRVIQELRENGISIIHLSDLLPLECFAEIQAWAEQLLSEPRNRDRIREIERGAQPDAKSDKFYLVRLLGDVPQLNIQDRVMDVALSDSILRIVCAYLGMFGRLAALDLWYNAATNGPDIKSQRWHRDPEDKRIVKTFMYLRDVDERNGPFCYIPGTHNDGPFSSFFPQSVGGGVYPKDGVVDSRFPTHLQRICTGEAGTLIFCDTTGFHRGGHTREGGRLLFNAVYTSNAAAPMIVRHKQFSLSASHLDRLGPAQAYAVGHLVAQ